MDLQDTQCDRRADPQILLTCQIVKCLFCKMLTKNLFLPLENATIERWFKGS